MYIIPRDKWILFSVFLSLSVCLFVCPGRFLKPFVPAWKQANYRYDKLRRDLYRQIYTGWLKSVWDKRRLVFVRLRLLPFTKSPFDIANWTFSGDIEFVHQKVLCCLGPIYIWMRQIMQVSQTKTVGWGLLSCFRQLSETKLFLVNSWKAPAETTVYDNSVINKQT